MSVGERIAELRKSNGMTQVQLANLLDVSRQAVSKWESDQSFPDSLKMIHLAEVLKTDIDYLTTGRINEAIRPPVVIKTVETIEKIVEIPVVETVEKIVEKPVIQYIERPVIKKLVKVRYRVPWILLTVISISFFLAGFLLGILI